MVAMMVGDQYVGQPPAGGLEGGFSTGAASGLDDAVAPVDGSCTSTP
jgi:hypothetical protein